MAAPSARIPTRTALRIVRQVADRLDGHGPSGDAFVVSVYGEWGIGKTRCLQDIRDAFQARLDDTLGALRSTVADRLTVPVFFDPWQYEHEDHLVVPLLKTIELALRKVAQQIDALPAPNGSQAEEFTQRAAALGATLKNAGGVFGDVAVSLLSGFRFRFAPLKEIIGIEVELSGKDAIESARRADERRAAAQPPPRPSVWQRFIGAPPPQPAADKPEPQPLDQARARLAQRESLYFDVRTQLSALTQGPPPQLRLVVLIDDLDRCLPEKAIQVLESVKLFLNVPGFSFVLAVDDEVVERGIAHRYRAYMPGSDKGDGNAHGAGAAPISGAEYLEKIVHLPVHLQRWTRDEAAIFLRDTYAALFAPPKTADPASARDGAAPDAGGGTRGVRQGAAAPQRSEDLLKLVLDALPLVPRKLIRLAEALEFQHQLFDDLGALELWQPQHAARVVALQQLYPALYRHLRLRAVRYWRLFGLERDDWGDPALRADKTPLSLLREHYSKRGSREPATPGTAATSSAQADTLRENLTLLELVDEAGRQRGNPDPLALFGAATTEADRSLDGIRKGLSYDDFAQLYLHGLALAAAPAVTAAPTPAAMTERVAEIDDPAELIERLFGADTLGRREYLQSKALSGRLPDVAFKALLLRASQDRDRVATDIEWLRDVATLTSPEQLLALYRRIKVLDALAGSDATAARPEMSRAPVPDGTATEGAN